MRMRAAFLFGLALVASSAWAAKYNLSQSQNYHSTLSQVSANDTVCFSDGNCFKILGVLGEGNTSKIFEIPGGRALRVALTPADERILRTFYDGYKALKRYGVATVTLDITNSNPSSYLIVEKIEILFSLEDFTHTNKARLLPEQRKQVESELLDFAESTWAFSSISDGHGGNIVYTDKGWKLIDWMSGHKLAQSTQSKTIFGSSPSNNFSLNPTSRIVTGIPTHLFDEIIERILVRRIEEGLPRRHCEELLYD